MGKRRDARVLALQALYLMDTARVPVEEAFIVVEPQGDALDPKTLSFARDLLNGTAAHMAELDVRIQAIATNWVIDRMAAVDRNILRLASFELLHNPDTPVGVIIDEAIEIAKEFCSDESGRFINGILDKVKDHRGAVPPGPPPDASESPPPPA